MKIVVTGPGMYTVWENGQGYRVGSALTGQVYCGSCAEYGCKHVKAVEKRLVRTL